MKWVIFEIVDFEKNYDFAISYNSLLKRIDNKFVGGETTIGKLVIEFVEKLLLINIDFAGVTLTSRANELINSEKELSYASLTKEQKYLLADWYINSLDPEKNYLFKIMNYENNTYFLNEKLIPKNYRQLVEELKFLNVLKKENNILLLNDLFLWCVSNLNDYALSEKELFSHLENQRKIGEIAEKMALDFEKSRLFKANKSTLAERVELISKTYVNAGFDIKSFSGNYPHYDRYIEVKTYSSEMLFYWSQNEKEIAQLLGDKYWIYVVDIRKESIYMINDPIKKISDLWLSIRPVNFEVSYRNLNYI